MSVEKPADVGFQAILFDTTPYKVYTARYGHPASYFRPTDEWRESMDSVPRFNRDSMDHKASVLSHSERAVALTHIYAGRLEHKGAVDAPFDKLKFDRFVHHDDPEHVTTDIPSHIKRAMSPTEREELKKKEYQALLNHGPSFTNLPLDVYIADQEEIHTKLTPESQLFDVMDKVEGLSNAINEYRAGKGEGYLKIIQRYRDEIFPEFQRYPFYDALEIKIPTDRELLRMKKVDPQLLVDGHEDEFWKAVYHRSIPGFYKEWLQVIMGESVFMATDAAIRLFPGWKEIILEVKSRKLGHAITEDEIAVEEEFFGDISF